MTGEVNKVPIVIPSQVADLKKELKDRGLAVSGTKDILLERLEATLDGTGYFNDVIS